MRTGHVVLVPDLRNLAGSDTDDAGPPDLDMGSTLDVVNAILALGRHAFVDSTGTTSH